MQPFVRSPGVLDPSFLLFAFEASGDCVKMLALDGTLLVINAGGAALMGFASPAVPVGRNWIDFWPDKDRAVARAAVETARAGTRAVFRGALATADGITKMWDNTILPVPGPDGVPGRLLVISRDVTEQHDAERALDRSARLHQALIEATSEIVWHLEVASGVTRRRGYVEFTGERDNADDLDGWLAAVHPEDRVAAKQAADRAEATSAPFVNEYRLHHRSGEWRWVEDHGIPLILDGTTTDWVGIITDIHDRKRAEQARQKSAEHLRLAVEATGLGSWDVDMLSGQREWSPEFYDLLEIPRHVLPNRELFISRIHPEDTGRVEQELRSSDADSGRSQVSIFRLQPPSGERWVEVHEQTFYGAGQSIRRVGTIQDITARKQAEHQLWLAAHADALTGVANRTLFQTRLDQAVLAAEGSGTSIGLLLIDLDRFKEVNDTLGHDAGDVLLKTVARRLEDCAPAAATVARLGGDEFGILVPSPDLLTELEALADRLIAALKRPLTYNDREVDCCASIGWAMYPDHDRSAPALLKNADVALYAAKSAGRGHALVFTPGMREEMERRINVLRCAKQALIRDAVMPFYQPKVSLVTGEIVGFEALLRWNDGAGIRPPGAIQEAFDDPELSVELGKRMLSRIVADMQCWTGNRVRFGSVALNMAAPEFHDRRLAQRILESLEAAGLPPKALEIEITERVLLDVGADTIRAALTRLHDVGIAIALDDFGTGYASLTHLKKFPVTWLKIDRSFTSNLERDNDSAAIVRAVVSLAHSIGIKVVGEGIETPQQAEFLRHIGCDLGQGYLIAKAMVGSRVPLFLERWTPSAAANLYPRMTAALASNAAG